MEVEAGGTLVAGLFHRSRHVCIPTRLLNLMLFVVLHPGQRQWERPGAAPASAAAAPAPTQPAFVPSPAFAGARPGYLFKLGPQGLGYYLDTPVSAATPHRDGSSGRVGQAVGVSVNSGLEAALP